MDYSKLEFLAYELYFYNVKFTFKVNT